MTFHSRVAWGARPPRNRASSIKSQGQKAHYNGPPLTSLEADHSRCPAAVRAIQSFHQNQRGWADIAYSYLVCPHGDVFEGRGAGRRTAANGTNDCNNRYEAVMVLIGDGQLFTIAARRGFLEAVDICRRAGSGNHIGSHSDCKATSCPGEAIRTWVRSGAQKPGRLPTPTSPEQKEDDMGWQTIVVGPGERIPIALPPCGWGADHGQGWFSIAADVPTPIEAGMGGPTGDWLWVWAGTLPKGREIGHDFKGHGAKILLVHNKGKHPVTVLIETKR